MGFNCTPCSGSDDSTTSGTGAANPLGDAQGQAYFSQNASADNENWVTQTSDRFNSFSWFVTGVPAFPHGMAMSDDADMNDAYQFLAGKEYGDGGQLTRLPGAVGPDASFYHTVSAKEKAPKPKADDGGQGDDDKSGNQGEEAPSASDYLFKLQTRQTGNGSATVDTTQLVNPSKSNLQVAADDASKNDEVGGSGLGDKISSAASNVVDKAEQFASSDDAQALKNTLGIANVKEGAVEYLEVAKDVEGLGNVVAGAEAAHQLAEGHPLDAAETALKPVLCAIMPQATLPLQAKDFLVNLDTSILNSFKAGAQNVINQMGSSNNDGSK